MADNLKGIPFSSDDEGKDIILIAKQLVLDQVHSLAFMDEHLEVTIHDIYPVWWCYTLGNWKGLFSTPVADGRYYEITFNKAKSEAYIDTYRKTHNIAVHFES